MKLTLTTTAFLACLTTSVWAESLPNVEVYKSPSCGCCEKWVEHMRSNGFQVKTHDTNEVAQHKAQLGVPEAMASCHTAKVGGYVIEGHVPASDVKRLLAEKPQAKGLASPGMPASAPGMDVPGNTPYQVFLINKDGSTSRFAKH